MGLAWKGGGFVSGNDFTGCGKTHHGEGYGLVGPGFRGCVRTGNSLNEGMAGVPLPLFHIIICIGLWTVVLTAYSVIATRLGPSWYAISFAARHQAR